MAKKKKRSQAISDSSDENIGWDHHHIWTCCPGEDPSRWQLQGYLYLEECKSTCQPTSSHQAFAQWTRRHHRPATDHQPPVTGQMGIIQEFSSQSTTGCQPSSHWSLDLQNINTGESQYSSATGQLATSQQTLYQPTFSETHAMGM